jgi:uncharacterized protein
MVAAALVVESLFQALGWVPQQRHRAVVDAAITFNYTTVLNIIFGAVFVVLTVTFLRTGGPEMMRMMEGGEYDHDSHGQPLTRSTKQPVRLTSPRIGDICSTAART